MSLINNLRGDVCSLQVSTIFTVEDSYESKTPFLIKNISTDTVELAVKLAGMTDYITTTFEPGWNPEICVGVQGVTSDIQLGR